MYTEILKLKKMLEKVNIPFEWDENHFDGFHLIYSSEGKTICSVVEFNGSYGACCDLLEIMGLMTEEEKQETEDDVLGWLTAEDVFNRIKSHRDSVQRETTAK